MGTTVIGTGSTDQAVAAVLTRGHSTVQVLCQTTAP